MEDQNSVIANLKRRIEFLEKENVRLSELLVAKGFEPTSTTDFSEVPVALNAKTRSLENIKVLLAEDNEVNQFLIRNLVENSGGSVDLATNGKEALMLWEKNEYDVILMDIQMPVLGGIETMVQIRASEIPGKSNISIIALTANSVKGQKEKYLDLGMNAHLSKALVEEDLLKVIFAALEASKVANTHQHIQYNQAGQLFDYSRLAKIAQGNKAFENKMMNIFIETVPDAYTKLSNYWVEDELKRLAETAHKLKTTVISMSIDQLKEPLKLLEQACLKQIKTDESLINLLKVRNTLKAIVDEFKTKINLR